MPTINRRSFLVGASVAVGASALLAETGLWRGFRFAPAPAPEAFTPGMVSIIEYSDAGKRIGPASVAKVIKTDAEWKAQLSPSSYQVTRHGDTEVPYSGKLDNFYKPGLYRCICCDNALFLSDTKYDAHEGWPSFWAPIAKQNFATLNDTSLDMDRTEVRCVRCDAHLGHLFDDGPQPTGLRYCMDSVSLKFVPRPAK